MDRALGRPFCPGGAGVAQGAYVSGGNQVSQVKRDGPFTGHQYGTLVRALDRALYAFQGLGFDEKRRLLRWLCDVFQIEPTRL